ESVREITRATIGGEFMRAHRGGVQEHSSQVAHRLLDETLLITATTGTVDLVLEQTEDVRPQRNHRGRDALPVADDVERVGVLAHDGARSIRRLQLFERSVQ